MAVSLHRPGPELAVDDVLALQSLDRVFDSFKGGVEQPSLFPRDADKETWDGTRWKEGRLWILSLQFRRIRGEAVAGMIFL